MDYAVSLQLQHKLAEPPTRLPRDYTLQLQIARTCPCLRYARRMVLCVYKQTELKDDYHTTGHHFSR
ncbi:zinc finger matrin-type protein 4 isoform X1 [Tachysurus ichikawai]